MTDLAIGAPMLFNAVLVGVLVALIQSVRSEMRAEIGRGNARLDSLGQRFDDLRDLWRAELLRVEGVIDARLQHLEQERR